MTDIVLDPTNAVNLLTGLLLPVVIAWLRSQRASSRYAATFAFVSCVVVALSEGFLSRKLLGETPGTVEGWARVLLTDTIVVLATAWLTYQNLWKPTLIVDKLETTGPQLGAPEATSSSTLDTSITTRRPS